MLPYLLQTLLITVIALLYSLRDDVILYITYFLVERVFWHNGFPYIYISLSITFVKFITWGQFWLSGIAFACVCLCVCLCVCPWLCQTKACLHNHLFKLELPNYDKRCKIPWLRSLIFWGLIDLDLQDHIQLKNQNLSIFMSRLPTRVNT